MPVKHDTHAILENNNTWVFPHLINFETASSYSQKFIDIPFNKNITFDLSNTENVHSSFIGFLIDLKQKIDTNGGLLTINPSPSLERLLNIINLHDYFLS